MSQCHLTPHGAKFYFLQNVLTDFLETIVMHHAHIQPTELYVEKGVTVRVLHAIISMVVISPHVSKILYIYISCIQNIRQKEFPFR